MEVATLSDKDAKATLSKKSPMPKKSVRKVMQSPYEATRPISTDVPEMEELMRRLLAPAKRSSNRIPWAKFKKMTPEERKKLKEEGKLQKGNKHLRDQLVYGMNELFFNISQHNLASGIVCEDIEPGFMMDFAINYASIHHVPIIILPNLRTLTKETLGFYCSCLGIKKQASFNETSHFYPMHKKIVEIAQEYGLPEKTHLLQCQGKEPMELHKYSASDEQQLQALYTRGLVAKNILKGNLAWPCALPNPTRYWKKKKEKWRKKDSQQQRKEIGDESQGESSAVVGAELLESEDDPEKRTNIPNTPPKSEGSQPHCYRKNSDSRPYMRTFLDYLRYVEKKKRKYESGIAESVDGEHAKRRKFALDPTEYKKFSEALRKKKERADANKVESFQYIMRTGNKRDHSMFHPYKTLKLADN